MKYKLRYRIHDRLERLHYETIERIRYCEIRKDSASAVTDVSATPSRWVTSKGTAATGMSRAGTGSSGHALHASARRDSLHN